ADLALEVARRVEVALGQVVAETERRHAWADAQHRRDLCIEAGPGEQPVVVAFHAMESGPGRAAIRAQAATQLDLEREARVVGPDAALDEERGGIEDAPCIGQRGRGARAGWRRDRGAPRAGRCVAGDATLMA